MDYNSAISCDVQGYRLQLNDMTYPGVCVSTMSLEQKHTTAKEHVCLLDKKAEAAQDPSDDGESSEAFVLKRPVSIGGGELFHYTP
ncbi:hypothetical protein ANCCAN_11581 [Ancylostoma caninum]|uniref:Uncharacterized protein n=1 Tax=Ancylostoma caninum TaxID=29170 RepID=A0A368GDJ9_ANCCA|nr:hypothetical protein ANCCAN_11581 [Ancylostoma caninum]